MEDYCRYQQRLLGAYPAPVLEKQSPFLQGLNKLFSLIGLKHFWRTTYVGLTLQVAQLRRQGQQLEALNLLIQGLTQCHFWTNHVARWWRLMRIAVSIAQDMQFNLKEKTCEPLQKLIKLSANSPQPWQGYDVAYSFVSFSLWSFEMGKTHKAVDYVNTAIHADPSWGYPEYLLGWYGLLLEGIDPVPHFVKGIQANWSFFQRLKQDPLCQHFPEVLQAVKMQILVKQGKGKLE
jgi:hypothetical protein